MKYYRFWESRPRRLCVDKFEIAHQRCLQFGLVDHLGLDVCDRGPGRAAVASWIGG